MEAFIEQTGLTAYPRLASGLLLPFPELGRRDELPDDWKLLILDAALESDPQSFIFADDIHPGGALGDRSTQRWADVPHSLIAPDERYGLTRDHLLQMPAFRDVV